MSNDLLQRIEGLGPVYQKKLKALNIHHCNELLEACITKKQREALAQKSEISEKLLFKFAVSADLFHIHGVGEEYAELLYEAGYHSPESIAKEKTAQLHAQLVSVNGDNKYVRLVPSEKQLANIQASAKTIKGTLRL